MRKSFMFTAAILLCAGVLVAGIGTGIAFKEFSKLKYDGIQEKSWIEMRTADFDFKLDKAQLAPDAETEIKIIKRHNGTINYEMHVLPELPEDIIRFRVNYNLTEGEINLNNMLSEEDDTLYIWLEYLYNSEYDGMEDFMRIKDDIIARLKEGHLVSYRQNTMDKIEVLVPQALEDKVMFD